MPVVSAKRYKSDHLSLHLVPVSLAHSTCMFDGLRIYKGLAPTQYPIATLCGNAIPGPFSTFGPMLLNFYSDSVVADNGFLAEYRAVGK